MKPWGLFTLFLFVLVGCAEPPVVVCEPPPEAGDRTPANQSQCELKSARDTVKSPPSSVFRERLRP